MHLFLSFFIDVMISEIRGHRKSREEIHVYGIYLRLVIQFLG